MHKPMLHAVLVFCSIVVPTLGFAAEVAAVSPAGMLAQTLLGLGLVVALIFGLAWCAKKLNLTQLAGGRGMRVVSQLGLGSREKILLIEVGDQQLLVGVAPGRVSTLHVFAEPVVLPDSAKPGSTKLAATSSTEFAKKLNEFIRLGGKS